MDIDDCKTLGYFVKSKINFDLNLSGIEILYEVNENKDLEIAKTNDYHFIFEDDQLVIDFYPVPAFSLFATDLKGGFVGFMSNNDQQDKKDRAVYYINQQKECYLISHSIDEFVKNGNKKLICGERFKDILFFHNKEEAIQQLNFVSKNMQPILKEKYKPHRDQIIENKLKTIIEDIENKIDDRNEQDYIEDRLNEASQYIKAKERVLDRDVIEHYTAWTDLDGLVSELTMFVPTDLKFTKFDLTALVFYIREAIANGEDFEYIMNFYQCLFEENLPQVDSFELFDMICGDTSIEKIIDFVFE